MSTPPFSAALLAGGRSSRMGQDKATLDWEGQPLWKHQITLLEQLKPREILISGRPDGPYVDSSYRILYDHEAGLGPLAGLASVLEAAECEFVLVLAVDMPWMNSAILEQLVSFGQGTVPHHEGWWEGTTAFYPKSLLPLVREHLASDDRSLQALIRAGIADDLLKTWDVDTGLHQSFRSWNRPDSNN